MHRDLKPENVLVFKVNGETRLKLDKNTKVQTIDTKLTDFGWACRVIPGVKETYRKTLCGTVSYIAPEQENAPEYSMEAETWSCSFISWN